MAESGPDPKPSPPKAKMGEPVKTEGFFQRILSLFGGIGDPDSEKKKILKSVAKDLNRSRYKFYKPKGQEALPGLAKVFFELYRVTAPAEVLLANATTSAALRSFMIDSFLTPDQKALQEKLSETALVERTKTQGLQTLQNEVKTDLVALQAVFDGDLSRQIDAAYNTLLSFVNFIGFDYYFLLKKFDSNLPEKNFAYRPKFEAINGDYIGDDLQDFLEVFMPIDLDADWPRIFEALHDYRNTDVIQVDAWQKLMEPLSELRKSQVLDQIIRHLKHDPYWTVDARYPNERIVEPYIQKLKTQVETILQRIAAERRNAKIDEVAINIFGTTVVLRMKNYTEKANVVFAKKMLGGYIHATALNYLKAYLIDYFKKDIREIADLLLIRGKWTANIQSQQLSDAYHALLEVSDQILRFDDSLADEGELGARLRSALIKSDRDKEQVKYLRTMLKDTNDKAAALVTKSAVNLITVGKHIKSLIEDHGRPHHELILNWKELEGASSRPINEWLVEIYKKIFYMVQLLQFFAKNSAEE